MCKIEINNKTFDADNYIGSYSLENSEVYAALGILNDYNNKDVKISLKKGNDEIIISGDSNVLGRLSIPEIDKKVFITYLRQNWGNILYTCKLMIIDNKPKVSIWVNEKVRCHTI